MCTASAGQIIYVDADANGATDGTSWADAYNYLQDALGVASSDDEIRVAAGIYKPDQGGGNIPSDRHATCQLISGVEIYGGYAGSGQPDPNARNIELYQTVLTGDLDGDDVDVNDPYGLLNEPTRNENSYHVVTGSGTQANAILDGVTITSGNANHNLGPDYLGGGLYNIAANATLANCTFTLNSAGLYGGAMFNEDSNPGMKKCTFSQNMAQFEGGAMWNYKYCSPTVSNCLFVGNHASSGAGMYNRWSSSPTLLNCTFSANSNRGLVDSGSSSTITNSIFWGGGILSQSGSTTIVSYSCVQDAHPNDGSVYPGIGNIDLDPCFVGAGYWDSNGVWVDGDYHLASGSPCIDAGDNNAVPPHITTDLDGNPRIVGCAVDMGAYEGPVPTIEVAIDIKPGSWPNAINLGSHGLVPVAIFSSEDFDATNVDPDTVELAGSGVEVRGKGNKYLAHTEDVDGDGLLDLVVQVATANLDPESLQNGVVILSGSTYDGQAIEGEDQITIVPPE
jgi:hypothetical protein